MGRRVDAFFPLMSGLRSRSELLIHVVCIPAFYLEKRSVRLDVVAVDGKPHSGAWGDAID